MKNKWITRIRASCGVSMAVHIAGYRYKITLRAFTPDHFVTLSHPDYNRRPRNYTGSADLRLPLFGNISARGLPR